jgi:hypothetical protein
VLGLEATRPEDATLPETVAQVLQVAWLVDMHPVGAAPRRHRDEVAGEARAGHHQRRAAALGDRRDLLHPGGEPALVGGGEPQDHGRDIARLAGRVERGREGVDAVGIQVVGPEQGEALLAAHRTGRPARYCAPIFGSSAPLA